MTAAYMSVMPQSLVPPSVLLCALGDSRTYGAGATVGCDPLTLLAARLRERYPTSQFAIDNQAVNGTSLRFWAHAEALDAALISFQQNALAITDETAVYVQIMLGINDGAADQRLSVDDYFQYMQALIQRILAAKICGFSGIILHSSFYAVPLQFSSAIDGGCIQLVKQYNAALPLITNDDNVFLGDQKAYGTFEAHPELLSDGVHANNEGNSMLATLWSLAYEGIFTQRHGSLR